MNQISIGGFFDELEKIAAAFRGSYLKNPLARGIAEAHGAGIDAAGGIKSALGAQARARSAQSLQAAGSGPFKAQVVPSSRPASSAAPVSILDKIKARNAAGKGATKRRFVSESASSQGQSVLNPQTGRSQVLMDRAKARTPATVPAATPSARVV